jgi:perosamine synthetase
LDVLSIMRMRHVAPAGAPIRLVDLFAAALRCAAGGDVSAGLRAAFKEQFGVRHIVLTSTGRAGMTMLMGALSRLAPERREVVVPAYTCYSVAASIVKAGLRPRIVDIDPATLDYSPDELRAVDFRRVLAIVATNLYGLPNDLPGLERVAREHGVFLVDDAAQSMGASIGGRPCGTWGDVGLFSLDKGKNVSAIDGGVVIAHDDRIGAALESAAAELSSPSVREAMVDVAKAAVYAVMLRPWLYWIPNRIPQLGLGQTEFTTEFPMHRPSRPLTALASTMMPRLDRLTRARVENATALLDGLRGVPGVRTVAPRPGSIPVYLRLPVFVEDAQGRQRTIEALREAGIGATASYPASLADVPGLQPYLAEGTVRASGGRMVARQIVTLPTHAFVSPADRARTLEVIAGAAPGPTASAYSVVQAR